MSLSTRGSKAIWIRRLYDEIHGQEYQGQLIRIDNQGSMKLAKNPKHHDRTKHIAIRHHFIREAIETGTVTLEHVSSADNVADILTKPLGSILHGRHMEGMGVKAFQA